MNPLPHIDPHDAPDLCHIGLLDRPTTMDDVYPVAMQDLAEAPADPQRSWVLGALAATATCYAAAVFTVWGGVALGIAMLVL